MGKDNCTAAVAQSDSPGPTSVQMLQFSTADADTTGGKESSCQLNSVKPERVPLFWVEIRIGLDFFLCWFRWVHRRLSGNIWARFTIWHQSRSVLLHSGFFSWSKYSCFINSFLYIQILLFFPISCLLGILYWIQIPMLDTRHVSSTNLPNILHIYIYSNLAKQHRFITWS